VKKPLEVIGLVHTIEGIIALVGVGFPPLLLTSSNVMRGFIISCSIVGGSLGYFLTIARWCGISKTKRMRRRTAYLWLVWVPLVTMFSTLIVLRPEVARLNTVLEWMEWIREILLATGLLPNVIVGVCAGLSCYLIIAAISLSASKVN
jgi:hypothetical protein